MSKKPGILVLSIISILMITGIFAQASLLSLPTSTEINSSNNTESRTPSTSSLNGNYDLGGNNSMDITSDDAVTSTILGTGSSNNDVLSYFAAGSDGFSRTVINDTYEVIADDEYEFVLHDIYSNDNTTLDYNSADYFKGLEIQSGDEIINIGAIENSVSGGIESFEMTNGTWWMKSGRVDGALEIDGIYEDMSTVVVYRCGTEGVDECVLVGDESEMYFNITMNGVIYWDEYGNGSWVIIGDYDAGIFGSYIAPFDAAVPYLEGEWGTHAFVIEDLANMWEVIVVWDNESYFDITVSSLASPIEISSPSRTPTITFSYESLVCIVHHDVSDLYFTVISDDLSIEWYAALMVIAWHSIDITVYFSDIAVHWIILFQWEWWFIKIQFWLDLIVGWEFADYLVWVEYRWTNYNWIYLYYVPVTLLPNRLSIQIVNELFDEKGDKFSIMFSVTDCWGALIDPDQLIVMWDGEDLSSEVEYNTGTYSVELNAIFVEEGDDPISLEITVKKMGYTNGYLSSDISVNVDGQSVPAVTTFGDLVSVVLAIVTAFIGALLGTGVVIKKLNRKKRNDLTPLSI